MRRVASLLLSGAAMLFFAVPALAVERPGEAYEGNPTAIVDVTTIDVTDGSATPHQTVVVRYGKIAHIKPAVEWETPGWMTEVDGSGRFLIPGLWDVHVHLSFWDEPEGDATTGGKPVQNDYSDVLRRLAVWGITTVRDMGGDLKAIDSWRERIGRGEATGPTVLRAGPYVDGPKPNDKFRLFVTTAREAREAVLELDKAGVDFVKIHSQVPPSVLPALTKKARRRGLRVAGHVPYGTSIGQLLGWSVSTIEHADALFISRLGSRQGSFEEWKAAYEWHFTAEGAALFEEMAARNMGFTPTLAMFDYGWDGVGEPWSALRTWYRDLAELAHRKGVRLLAGTDVARKTGPIQPGVGLHEELEHLVDIGLEPWEALRAATLYPASVLGREAEVGTIEPGRIADLVLLSSDPRQNIRNTRQIEAVFLRGRLLDAERLRALGRNGDR